MKTCKRLMNYIQIINAEGDVRACGWNRDNIIGNLQNEDITNILNSEKAKKLKKMINNGDYSNCPADRCPYLANNTIQDMLIDYDENEEIKYPEELYLAFEGKCNYNCTCCTSYKHMDDTRKNDYSQLYRSLEDKLKPILPYIKCIGANGRGELFASQHILDLLAEWKPLAPEEELSVSLETNGSLFNERNWERIKHIGCYNLTVSVTVMSFDENTYQYLSGTNLPISNIINNLYFLKKLRTEGIINELEIATVMQELNFREMPEFAQRCIDDFGADIVRIRAIVPGGRLEKDYQWFTDVRNPNHPYHSIYKKILNSPILKNPKVQLWSGDMDSPNSFLPSKKDAAIKNAVNCLLGNPKLVDNFVEKFGNISIYGMGELGKTVFEIIPKNNVKYIIDSNPSLKEFKGYKVYGINEVDLAEIGVLLVTAYNCCEEIKQTFYKYGYGGKVIDLFSELK